MPPPSSHARVLLTGGTGFIASHILDQLLDLGYLVTATVRSSEKGKILLASLPEKFQAQVDYAIVRDVVAENAFDDAVKSAPFTFVIHTAMPYHTNCSDPVKDFIDPAVKGTTGILSAAHLYSPTIKRVVLTSSSATILNIKNHEKMYNEDSYSPLTLEDAMENPHFAYSTGKTIGERAAWKFCEDNNPSFELSMINNTYTFGPVQRFLTSPSQVNTSNHCILAMVRGEMKHALEPTAKIVTFVDVRDVATAHVRAMTVPEAAGKRFFVVADYFTNKAISEAIRERLPELDEDLPPRDSHDELPAWAYGFDNSRSKAVLGLTYTPLAKCVGDTAESMMQFREANK
ncbi:putative NADPH-dependent methylglyoxal reductaseGRP2 [Ceratocystis lukuohia]|uniref:NADPH-dependent methylglyoxal reductaseGRP2 n=1 Tax=Ceratocystis lukuohia TaxID=2019550 RepID=A0ABR4M8T6_9PEZI